MAIIKNNDARRITRDAVVLDLSDLHQQADRILDHARERADALIAEAERRANAMIEAAASKGHDEGFAAGVEDGRTAGTQAGREEVVAQFQPQLNAITKAWSDQLELWEQARTDLLAEAGTDVLRFAFALAERIVRRQVEFDPAVIEAQLAEALTLVTDPTSLVIAINPADRAIVEQVLPQLLSKINESAHATLRDDDAIERGGCRIITAGGSVDATIERQLDRLAELLLPMNQRLSDADAGNSRASIDADMDDVL